MNLARGTASLMVCFRNNLIKNGCGGEVRRCFPRTCRRRQAAPSPAARLGRCLRDRPVRSLSVPLRSPQPPPNLLRGDQKPVVTDSPLLPWNSVPKHGNPTKMFLVAEMTVFVCSFCFISVLNFIFQYLNLLSSFFLILVVTSIFSHSHVK